MHSGGRNPTPETTRSAPAWRTVLDWLLFTAVLYMGSLLLLSAKEAADASAQQSIIKHEARALFRAFESYYERNRSYPNSYTHSYTYANSHFNRYSYSNPHANSYTHAYHIRPKHCLPANSKNEYKYKH